MLKARAQYCPRLFLSCSSDALKGVPFTLEDLLLTEKFFLVLGERRSITLQNVRAIFSVIIYNFLLWLYLALVSRRV